MGLETTLNPLQGHPSYDALAALPRAERLQALRRAEVRERILCEEPTRQHPFFAMFGQRWERYFPMRNPPEYEPRSESSVRAAADRMSCDPLAIVYDTLLSNDGSGLLYVPFLNFSDSNLDAVRTMMLHPHAVFGLADGGAHVGTICDASATTTTLTHWGRDRAHGRLPLPWLIRFLTRSPAQAVGLFDRGLIQIGKKADLLVLDFDELRTERPELRWDLPAGGRRFLQRAHGYRATIVSGNLTYRDGEATGALPGKLIRNQRSD
jgi:N-acyl-D-aspartate/D-glutamate deacylase